MRLYQLTTLSDVYKRQEQERIVAKIDMVLDTMNEILRAV